MFDKEQIYYGLSCSARGKLTVLAMPEICTDDEIDKQSSEFVIFGKSFS